MAVKIAAEGDPQLFDGDFISIIFTSIYIPEPPTKLGIFGHIMNGCRLNEHCPRDGTFFAAYLAQSVQ
jgi:hypothetical protein